jgi:Ser-tRNA(Ala) deacylase AlaX
MVEVTAYPKTTKAYFNDTYCFKQVSKVLDVFAAPEPSNNSFIMVLDSTIFHPQGGGQPNDEGFIKHADSNS